MMPFGVSGQPGHRASKPSLGTFIKTPSPAVVEVLAQSGLNFAILDAEHAPIDRGAMDVMLMAGLALGFPLFVRVHDASASALLNALDLGAAGVVIPHVENEAMAREFVARTKYRGGNRGFSSSPRASGYGTRTMADAIAHGDTCTVICQVESPKAVEHARAIAAVPGVDALFIGRADLALAMGFDSAARPEVDTAVDRVVAAARAEGKAIVMAVGGTTERDHYANRGADWIVVGSDQAFIRQGATLACS